MLINGINILDVIVGRHIMANFASGIKSKSLLYFQHTEPFYNIHHVKLAVLPHPTSDSTTR